MYSICLVHGGTYILYSVHIGSTVLYSCNINSHCAKYRQTLCKQTEPVTDRSQCKGIYTVCPALCTYCTVQYTVYIYKYCRSGTDKIRINWSDPELITEHQEPIHIFTNTKFSNCFLLNLLLYVKLFKLLMCQNLFIKKNILFINAGLGKDPVPVSPDLAKKVRILIQKVLVVLWI